MSKENLASKIAQYLVENPKRTVLLFALLNLTAALVFMGATVTAQGEAGGASSDRGLGLIGAGLAIAGSTIGAGIAVWGATSAGIAAIVEKPGMASWVILFAGLGEGIAVWGFVISIMILGKI